MQGTLGGLFPSHLEIQSDSSAPAEVYRLTGTPSQPSMVEQAQPVLVRDEAEAGRDRTTIDPRADLMTWVRDNWSDGMGLEVWDGTQENARSFSHTIGKPGDANEEKYGGIYTGVPGKLMLGFQLVESLDLGTGAAVLPAITVLDKDPIVVWRGLAGNVIQVRSGAGADGWADISIGSATHQGHVTSDENFVYHQGAATNLRKVSKAGALLNQFTDATGFSPVIAFDRIYFLENDTVNQVLKVRRGSFSSTTSTVIGSLSFKTTGTPRASNLIFGGNRLFLVHGSLGHNMRLWEIVNDVLVPRVDLPVGFLVPDVADQFGQVRIAVANDTVFIPGFFRRRRPDAAIEGVVVAVERGRTRLLGPIDEVMFWAAEPGLNEVWLTGTGDINTSTGELRDRNGVYRLDLTTGGIAKYSGAYPGQLGLPMNGSIAKGSRNNKSDSDGVLYVPILESEVGSTAAVYRTTNGANLAYCSEATVVEPIYDFRTPIIQKLLTEVEINVESMPASAGKVSVAISLDGDDDNLVTTDAFGAPLQITSEDGVKTKRFVMSAFDNERSFKFMQPRTILTAGKSSAGVTDRETPVVLSLSYKCKPLGSELFYRFLVDLSPEAADDRLLSGRQLTGSQLLQSLRRLRDNPKDRVYRIRAAYADDQAPYPPGDEEPFDATLYGWTWRSTDEGKGVCELVFWRVEVPDA